MLTCRHVHVRPKRAHVEWNWPISREKYLKIDWYVKMPLHWLIRDFKIWYGEAVVRLLSCRSLAFYYGNVSSFTYSSLRECKPAVYF